MFRRGFHCSLGLLLAALCAPGALGGCATLTLAGSTPGGAALDGAGAGARFGSNLGFVAYSARARAVLLADTENAVLRVLALQPGSTALVTTLGAPGGGGYADGPAAAALFSQPAALAEDAASGALIVADAGNHVLRAIAPDGERAVTTLAGAAGVSGMVDGPALGGALLNGPYDVRQTAAGDLVVAEPSSHALRLYSAASATVSTLVGSGAGSAGGYADGPAASARLNTPLSVAVHPSGAALYIADSGNNVIRVLTFGAGGAGEPGAVLSTLAGSPAGAAALVDGAGAAASFGGAAAFSLGQLQFYTAGAAGEAPLLLAADTAVHALRVVRVNGTVATLAQAGAPPLASPFGLALGAGRVWVAEYGSGLVRVLEGCDWFSEGEDGALSASASASPAATASATASATATATPTQSASASPTQSASASPTPSGSASPTPSASAPPPSSPSAPPAQQTALPTPSASGSAQGAAPGTRSPSATPSASGGGGGASLGAAQGAPPPAPAPGCCSAAQTAALAVVLGVLLPLGALGAVWWRWRQRSGEQSRAGGGRLGSSSAAAGGTWGRAACLRALSDACSGSGRASARKLFGGRAPPLAGGVPAAALGSSSTMVFQANPFGGQGSSSSASALARTAPRASPAQGASPSDRAAHLGSFFAIDRRASPGGSARRSGGGGGAAAGSPGEGLPGTPSP